MWARLRLRLGYLTALTHSLWIGKRSEPKECHFRVPGEDVHLGRFVFFSDIASLGISESKWERTRRLRKRAHEPLWGSVSSSVKWVSSCLPGNGVQGDTADSSCAQDTQEMGFSRPARLLVSGGQLIHTLTFFSPSLSLPSPFSPPPCLPLTLPSAPSRASDALGVDPGRCQFSVAQVPSGGPRASPLRTIGCALGHFAVQVPGSWWWQTQPGGVQPAASGSPGNVDSQRGADGLVLPAGLPGFQFPSSGDPGRRPEL